MCQVLGGTSGLMSKYTYNNLKKSFWIQYFVTSSLLKLLENVVIYFRSSPNYPVLF